MATRRLTAAAHFDLYCQAMSEIGADTAVVSRFLERVRVNGIECALVKAAVPEPARRFVATIFGFIRTDKAHVVAAAFAIGHEQVIPGMFRALLGSIGVGEEKAPAFHRYLERHIHLDDAVQGPMALQLLTELWSGDSRQVAQAEQAAKKASEALVQFWDEVRSVLRLGRSAVDLALPATSGALLPYALWGSGPVD